MNVLEMKHIRKSYRAGVTVLNDLSLSVAEGEVLALIGSSGSGKSTVLRCAAQLERIDCGEIVICGKTLVRTGQRTDRAGKAEPVAVYAPAAERKQMLACVGMVFQNFNLFPHMTVLRNITDAPVRVLGKPKAETEQNARELLKTMGLSDRADAYPCELSGGQQQRVSIARALAMKPRVLLFDEPTSALDPELTGEVLGVMRRLADEGMTMLVVTHELGFAKNISSRTMFIEGGVVVEEAPSREFFANPTQERTKAFLRAISSKEEE